MKTALALLIAACSLSSAAAHAQTAPPPAPRDYTHDGFFARVMLGVASTRLTVDGVPGSVSSVGGVFSIMFGGAVTPHVLLFGDFFGRRANTFTVDAGPPTLTAAATVGGLGAGAAYCVMPINVCLSGELAFASVTLEGALGGANGQPSPDDIAGALKLGVSKEWWVAREVAAGVAVDWLGTGPMPSTETFRNVDDARWRASSFALLATLTYN